MTTTTATKTKRARGGSKSKVIGGVPDPILISERVAVQLFADVGLTRRQLRTWVERGDILRRKLTVNKRDNFGLIYQELCLLAQTLPIAEPNEGDTL